MVSVQNYQEEVSLQALPETALPGDPHHTPVSRPTRHLLWVDDNPQVAQGSLQYRAFVAIRQLSLPFL